MHFKVKVQGSMSRFKVLGQGARFHFKVQDQGSRSGFKVGVPAGVPGVKVGISKQYKNTEIEQGRVFRGCSGGVPGVKVQGSRSGFRVKVLSQGRQTRTLAVEPGTMNPNLEPSP